MGDYIVRATAADNQIRAFAATTRELVEKARLAHNTSPVATAALGRLLTGGAMMGVMMKGEKDVLTIQVKGDGPIGGLTVTADSQGHVKGYVDNPEVMLPANALGKLDVGGAVGHGMLRVIKDMGLKEPYVGQVALETGELGRDCIFGCMGLKTEVIPMKIVVWMFMNQKLQYNYYNGVYTGKTKQFFINFCTSGGRVFSYSCPRGGRYPYH